MPIRQQAFRYELRPTVAQQSKMRQFAGSARYVFNRALAVQNQEREKTGQKLSGYAALCRMLTQWRNTPETAWLSESPVHTTQQALRNLESAWSRHFDSVKKVKQGTITPDQLAIYLMKNSKIRTDPFDATFAALADSTRRAILKRLAAVEASVNELAAPFKLSQPTISKHLKVLEGAGLTAPGRDAQRRPRRLLSAAAGRRHGVAARIWQPENAAIDHATPGECEIVLKRMFAAPRPWVFDAFTKPELLKRWLFGVPDGSLALCRVALKQAKCFATYGELRLQRRWA